MAARITKRNAAVVISAGLIFSLGILLRQRPWQPSRLSINEAKANLKTALRETLKTEHQALFAHYLDIIGADGILDVLEHAYNLCHSQAHPLGMAVVAKTRTIDEAIAACRGRCTGGCFHGVLMAALKDYAKAPSDDPEGHIEFDQLLAHAKDICDDPKTTRIHRRGNCAHGVGHALTFLAGYRLAEALDACRSFTEQPLQYYCSSGAFMERDIVYGHADAATSSALAPCSQEETFPAACYRYKVKRLLRPGTTVEDIANRCLGLENLQRLGCFHGLGFSLLDDVFREPAMLAEVCRFGNADDQKICIEGAIEKLADYDRGRAKAACKTLAPELRDHCRQAINYGLYSLEKPFSSYFPVP